MFGLISVGEYVEFRQPGVWLALVRRYLCFLVDWDRLMREPPLPGRAGIAAGGGGDEFMTERPSRVEFILRNSVCDVNYKYSVPLLTDKELLYCLERETRKSGLKLLLQEAKRRKLK